MEKMIASSSKRTLLSRRGASIRIDRKEVKSCDSVVEDNVERWRPNSDEVLTDIDHCSHVILNAHAGAAFPSDKISEEFSAYVLVSVDTGSGKTTKSKVTLFSGFVSYQMFWDAYDAGRSRFGSLMPPGHNSGKADRLYMKGPGVRGEVEVAASGVMDQSQSARGPFSPVHVSYSVFGTMIHKAAFMAQAAAKQAYAPASSSRILDNGPPQVLPNVYITAPWEHIAYDLLLKGTPPVNM